MLRSMDRGKTDVRLQYMPQLDGLRAVAVVLVIVHHLLLPTWFGGWIGIDVFFVLSGYLITSLLLVEIRRTGTVHLRSFYARRLLRLYPPLIVAVVVMLPVGLIFWHSALGYLASSFVALTYTANIVATVMGKGVGPWTHTWTLALEEQFYLVWPLILMALLRIRTSTRARVAIVTVLAVVSVTASAFLYRSDDAANFNPLLHAGPLLLGCALALTPAWRAAASTAVFGWTAIIVLAAGVALASIQSFAGGAEPIAILGSLLLVAHLAAGRGAIVTAFSSRPAVSIGRVSYEMYLWHYAVLIVLGEALRNRPIIDAITIVATVAAAYLSRRYISAPLSRRLKPRLERFTARAEQPAPASA